MIFDSIKHPYRFVWDFWYYYEPDTRLFHIFYLNADPNLVKTNEHHFAARVGYASTKDFVDIDWGEEESFDIIQPKANHWANTSIWSGDIIKINNGYLLFYTSRNKFQDDGMTQNIGVAYTKSLSSLDWQVYNTKIQPQLYYQPKNIVGDLTTHAWRDPFLFKDNDYVYMILSAKSTDDPIGKNGVVGLLRTKKYDFSQVVKGTQDWEYLKPLVKPQCFSEMEVPQLYKNNHGNYELTFSSWAKNDLAPNTDNAGGLESIKISQTWDFNNNQTSSINSNKDIYVLMPEISGLYACRIVPELDGEIIGFDVKNGGIRRSGMKTKFQSVNRNFTDFII